MDNTLPMLVAAHPILFKRRKKPDGFLPPGWYALAHELCSEFEKVLGDQATALKVWTVKAKFAELRVYVTLDLPEPPGEPLEPVVREHAGGASIAPQRRHPLRQAIEKLITDATERSTRLCQWCGAPSQLLIDGGWVYTACPAHAEAGSITLEEYERRRKAKAKKGQGDDDGW